ncbi:MAG: hydantoinase B/oxoprolinase family protein [Burkholderiales bacterium]
MQMLHEAAPVVADRVDPVTVEVIRRRLISIADQVDMNITRTAFSPLVYEYKDYAVGIVDHAGRLLAQCTGGMPIFVADVLGAAVRDGLAIYGPERLHEGDIVISNHGGTIGQHLNNVVMYTPIYAVDRRLAGFFVVVVHWLDIGGRVIGSISKHATDIFQEGIQFRTVKLFSKGEPVEEMFRMIEYNTRFPEEMMGDIEAQIGGCKMGCAEVAAIVDRYGLDTFRTAVETIWDQSESAARAVIREIPDGIYTAAAELDNDGIRPEPPIPLAVKVTVAGDRMTIDLSDLPKELASPLNAGRSGGGQSVARLAFRYVVIPHEHATEGSFRPLELVLPEGTMMSASPNAAKGYYVGALPTLIDLVIRALSGAIPDRVAAAHYGTFSTIRFVGRQPHNGALFQTSDSGFGGWGATCDMDGPGPFRTMCHGDTRTIPVEVQEAGYPLRIERFALRTDSGGAGEFRGGLGLERNYLALAPCTLYTVFDRTRCPPWGVNGGGDASPASVTIVRRDGTRHSGLRDDIALATGDRVLVDTGGGGGFGDPRRRTRARVKEDVLRGYVSSDAACSVYGAVEDSDESK